MLPAAVCPIDQNRVQIFAHIAGVFQLVIASVCGGFSLKKNQLAKKSSK
jgi:hypothetical protein